MFSTDFTELHEPSTQAFSVPPFQPFQGLSGTPAFGSSSQSTIFNQSPAPADLNDQLPYNFTPQVFQSTAPHRLQQPDPAFNFDFGLLDTTMMDLSNSFLPSGVTAGTSTQQLYASNLINDPLESLSGDPLESLMADPVNASVPNQGIFGLGPIQGFAMSNSSGASSIEPRLEPDGVDEGNRAMDSVLEVESASGWSSFPASAPHIGVGGYGVVGGWFDASDIPPHVRDHL